MTAPQPDDRELSLALRGWLREEDQPVPGRARKVDEVMVRVDETGQRVRWWPLLPFTRRAHRPTRGSIRGTRARGLPAAASVVLVLVGSLLLLYASTLTPADVPGAAGLDPADRVLFERLSAVWSGSPTDEEVAQVYAEDAVHTAMWTDRVGRYVGPTEIAQQIRRSLTLPPRELDYERLPDSFEGYRRYLAVRPEFGGMPCLFRVDGDRIDRHDCILPMPSQGVPFTPGEPPVDISRAELGRLISAAWTGDREAFDAVVSPDIVHFVAFENGPITRRGLDAYWAVAQGTSAPNELTPAIDLQAPEGELRWTDFSDVGRGTLCTFWARGDRLIRHDCVVPANSP